jgi:hypothetical protein
LVTLDSFAAMTAKMLPALHRGCVKGRVAAHDRDHSLNAKDNFRFERTITGWRDGRVVDLRRKG